MGTCIYRGSHGIGGTCVEVESQNRRTVLDYPKGDPLRNYRTPPVKGGARPRRVADG